MTEQRTNKEARRRQRKPSIKMAVVKALSDDKTLFALVDSMLEQAFRGNVQAATWIRDTAGQKPASRAADTITGGIVVSWI